MPEPIRLFMPSNSEIMARAKAAVRFDFAHIVIWEIVYCAVFVFGTSMIAFLPFSQSEMSWISAFLAPFDLMFWIALLMLLRSELFGKPADPNTLLRGALHRYGAVLWGRFVVGLLTMLGALLLIVPGILVALNYAATEYFLIGDPQMSVSDAMKRSKVLMYGHRWQLVCLGFRFFGWWLLTVLTCGLLAIYVLPYSVTAMYAFFDSIAPEADDERGALVPEAASYPGMAVGLVLLLALWQIGAVYLTNVSQKRYSYDRFCSHTCVQHLRETKDALTKDGKPLSAESAAALAAEHPAIFCCPVSKHVGLFDFIYCGHLPGGLLLVELPGNHGDLLLVLCANGKVKVCSQAQLLKGGNVKAFLYRNGLPAAPELVKYLEERLAAGPVPLPAVQ